MTYQPFRKNFYMEVPEITAMSSGGKYSIYFTFISHNWKLASNHELKIFFLYCYSVIACIPKITPCPLLTHPCTLDHLYVL